MENHELGIYTVKGFNDAECEKILLENATFDECIKEMRKNKILKNQYFNIYDTKTCSSWSYSSDYEEIPSHSFYEFFGFESDIRMTRELMIEVLMADRCTRAEAENFLKAGTTIYTDKQEIIEVAREVSADETTITLDNIQNGNVTEISYVRYHNNEYYIVYVN